MADKEAKKDAKKKRKDEDRGQKGRAEDDDIEQERIGDAVPEDEKGQKRKAEDDAIEQERIREQAAASDERMTIDAVYGGGSQEQAWGDVRGGLLDGGGAEGAAGGG